MSGCTTSQANAPMITPFLNTRNTRNKCHLLKKFKVDWLKMMLSEYWQQLALCHLRWNVAQMEDRTRWENIVVILGEGLFEAMQRRVCIVLGKSLISSFFRHLYLWMLWVGNLQRPTAQRNSIQVLQCCGTRKIWSLKVRIGAGNVFP